MKKTLFVSAMAVLAGSAFGQITGTMTPLSSFGTNGWANPGFHSWLDTGNLTRGMAFNSTTGNIYVASRAGGASVQVISGLTGASLGTLNIGGVSGGAFPLNMVSVSADGQIFLANLTTDSSASPFKIYRWASEADAATNAPTLVYEGAPRTGTARLGDTFDAFGSGSNIRLAAGYGTGQIGYSVFAPNGSGGFDANDVNFTTGVASGDFRLGITFLGDGNTVLGTQGGGTINHARLTQYQLGSNAGTFLGTSPLTTGSQRLMDYRVINGIPVLATVDTNDSFVRVYDMTDPLNPQFLAIDRLATHVGNANGVGSIQWGNVTGSTATLYAMNTNNGIQAFNVEVVPEPASLAALGIGALALMRRRRRAQ
jgi:hypothetical protein